MNKPQLDLLKQIAKTELFDYSNLTSEEREILFYLRDNKFISPKSTPDSGERPFYKITELGRAKLYENEKENIKFILPIFLSGLAILISIANLVLSILGVI